MRSRPDSRRDPLVGGRARARAHARVQWPVEEGEEEVGEEEEGEEEEVEELELLLPPSLPLGLPRLSEYLLLPGQSLSERLSERARACAPKVPERSPENPGRKVGELQERKNWMKAQTRTHARTHAERAQARTHARTQVFPVLCKFALSGFATPAGLTRPDKDNESGLTVGSGLGT